MKLFKPDVLSTKQIEYRKRIRAQGRKHFIVHTGILRFGMSAFVLTALCEEYVSRFPPGGKLWFLIIWGLVFWPVGSYFRGAYMWRWLVEGLPPDEG